MTNDNWIENQLSARVEAIEAAARAIMATDLSWDDCDDTIHGYWLSYAAAAVDAVRVPVLLNDLADRIEADRLIDAPFDRAEDEYNEAIRDAAGLVRAAAEGWGEA
jgi:hypothetical protein